MAKRISDTERITQYFMETELSVAEAQLQTVKAILASRQKQNGSAAPTNKVARATRTRRTAGPVESTQQASALDLGGAAASV